MPDSRRIALPVLASSDRISSRSFGIGFRVSLFEPFLPRSRSNSIPSLFNALHTPARCRQPMCCVFKRLHTPVGGGGAIRVSKSKCAAGLCLDVFSASAVSAEEGRCLSGTSGREFGIPGCRYRMRRPQWLHPHAVWKSTLPSLCSTARRSRICISSLQQRGEWASSVGRGGGVTWGPVACLASSIAPSLCQALRNHP